MIGHIKMRQAFHDIWLMVLSGQVLHTSNSSLLFLNFEDSVLVQTLSYRRKLTYQPLLIGFFHELIPVQDVVHNMLHLNVAKEL